MTKWQRSRFVIALMFIVIGAISFCIFSYFGYELIVLPYKEIEQGHEMVLWVSLVLSFSAFVVASIFAFTLINEISKKAFKFLLLPMLFSGIFVVGIPLFQITYSFINNNA